MGNRKWSGCRKGGEGRCEGLESCVLGQVTLGKSLVSPGFPSLTPPSHCALWEPWSGVAAKGQGSPRDTWPPVLSSQLHLLRVAMRLPLGSMGSH